MGRTTGPVRRAKERAGPMPIELPPMPWGQLGNVSSRGGRTLRGSFRNSLIVGAHGWRHPLQVPRDQVARQNATCRPATDTPVPSEFLSRCSRFPWTAFRHPFRATSQSFRTLAVFPVPIHTSPSPPRARPLHLHRHRRIRPGARPNANLLGTRRPACQTPPVCPGQNDLCRPRMARLALPYRQPVGSFTVLQLCRKLTSDLMLSPHRPAGLFVACFAGTSTLT
jgi:hypothetical protein